jgi:hypothetical protein
MGHAEELRVTQYLLIDSGKAWAKITSGAGEDTAKIKELARKALPPERAGRIARSIVRAFLNSPYQEMK